MIEEFQEILNSCGMLYIRDKNTLHIIGEEENVINRLQELRDEIEWELVATRSSAIQTSQKTLFGYCYSTGSVYEHYSPYCRNKNKRKYFEENLISLLKRVATRQLEIKREKLFFDDDDDDSVKNAKEILKLINQNKGTIYDEEDNIKEEIEEELIALLDSDIYRVWEPKNAEWEEEDIYNANDFIDIIYARIKDNINLIYYSEKEELEKIDKLLWKNLRKVLKELDKKEYSPQDECYEQHFIEICDGVYACRTNKKGNYFVHTNDGHNIGYLSADEIIYFLQELGYVKALEYYYNKSWR